MRLEHVFKHRLKVFPNNDCNSILRYNLEKTPFRLLSMEIMGVPEALQDLLANFWLTSDLRQADIALFLFNSCK